jgi:glutathione-regulated potassium-efflux system ancillary protein KefC
MALLLETDLDFIWILFAYVCGWLFKKISLPPLIGYLSAGFIMHALDFVPFAGMQGLADLGITLMLFTIGLKLNVKDLLKPEIFFGATTHMVLWTLLFVVVLFALSIVGLPAFTDITLFQSALIAFALSFSSTVAVVKLLEENGEMKSRQGSIAIGILILQDIIAVGFLVIATGKTPTIWALSLVLLFPLKKLIDHLLEDTGHAELLPLSGFFLALGAYEWFHLVGLKGDLGALIMGTMLASHRKAIELAKSLLSFKDLFLIGFFLSIGFTALPTLPMLMTALVISLFLILKQALFFGLLSWMKLRIRTGYLTSILLGNFSEFGLIVIAICVSNNWLEPQWLVILALAVSLSFVFTSLLYRNAHTNYAVFRPYLNRFERFQYVKPAEMKAAEDSEILVVGLGRVGSSAFNAIKQAHPGVVFGFDSSLRRIEYLKAHEDNVAFADGEDIELWSQFKFKNLHLVLLALPTVKDSKTVSEQLRAAGYTGKIVAISRFDDEASGLEAAGIDKVLNLMNNAGAGFAEESLSLLRKSDSLEGSQV